MLVVRLLPVTQDIPQKELLKGDEHYDKTTLNISQPGVWL